MEQSHDYNSELPSLVLGGGGPFGIAFEYGIYESLQGAGIDLADAQMLGTSAGSWVASFIATGRDYSDVADIPQIKVPNWQPGFLQGIAREVLGNDRASNVRTMAYRLPSREHPIPGPQKLRGIDLADMVAASSAVPGLFRPVRIGNESYVDGGVRSIVSADVAPKSHRVLAIAALGQHLKQPIGQHKLAVGPALEWQLRRELNSWKQRHGGEVAYIQPNEKIAGMVEGPGDLFNFDIAHRVYDMAREQGEEVVERWRDMGTLALWLTRQPI
ncbi:MAG: patatin-like phospholipase family protein [Candidatus Nomurabacteria bacterium]|nr:MAG: patatin-like phospholipase family protein [Candidatus Nomurabacteria bacterium]